METKVNAVGFGRKGWWIIIYTLLLYLFTSTASDSLNVVTTGFAEIIGGGTTSSSLLIFAAVGGFVGVPISIIAGNVIRKKSVKWPTLVLLVLLGITWICYGMCSTLVGYAVAAVLISALANTVNLVPTQQLVNNWFPKKKGIALGWATMGMPIDSAISVAIFQFLMNHYGFRTPFVLWGVIFFVLVVLLIFFVKSYPEEAGAYPDNEVISEEERQHNIELLNNYQSDFTVGKLFRTRAFWAIVIIFGFMFMGLIGTIAQLVPRLMFVGIEQNTAIMWLTIASIVGIPTSFMWGIIDQKFGTKRTVVLYAALWTAMMVLAAIGSGTVNVGIAVASVIFLSCMHGGMGNLMPSLIIQIFGRYDFAAANRIITPFVVAIRTFSLLIIPAFLAAAGPNGNVGFRNTFILFGTLSAISLIIAIFTKGKCIGKE